MAPKKAPPQKPANPESAPGVGGGEEKPKRKRKVETVSDTNKNPPADYKKRKEIRDQAEKDIIAKAFSHFEGLSENGANAILGAIKVDDPSGHADVKFGKDILASVNDAVNNKTLSSEEAIRILTQTAAIYSRDGDFLTSCTAKINNLVQEGLKTGKKTTTEQALNDAVKQLGRSTYDGELDENIIPQVITAIEDNITTESGDSIINQDEAGLLFEKGMLERENRSQFEVFGRAEDIPSAIAGVVENIYSELESYPDPNAKLRDVSWLEQKQQEIARQAAIAAKADTEARLMAREFNLKLEDYKQETQQEQARRDIERQKAARMTPELNTKREVNRQSLAQDSAVIGQILEKENQAEQVQGAEGQTVQSVRHPLSDEVKDLISDINNAILGQDLGTGRPIGYSDVANLRQKLEEIKLNHQYDAYYASDVPKIEKVIGDLEQKYALFTEQEIALQGYDRLKEAGLPANENDPLRQTLSLVTNQELFFAQLSTKNTPEERQEYIDKFFKDVKNLSTELLAVIRTDQIQFSDQIFNPLIHEPIYNSIVTGLNRIVLGLRQRDVRFTDGTVMDRHMVEVREYDYKNQCFIYEKVTTGTAISELMEWVSSEKWWEKYSHDVSVLYNTHQYDAFGKFAQQVQMERISKLLTENPELDTAINLHVAFVQTAYGLNGWKAPLDIYTSNIKAKGVPVDEYVRNGLRNLYPDLSEKEIGRLVDRAKGFALGISLEGTDIILSGGAPILGPTEPFGPISLNPLITVERFMKDPVKMHDYLYTRFKLKGGKMRMVAQEAGDAQQERLRRSGEERSRFFTFDEINNKGICFMDMWDFLLQTGGFDAREYRWRGIGMYEHMGIKDPVSTKDLKGEKLKKAQENNRPLEKLIISNPKYANSYIENQYFTGKISKELLYEWRSKIWRRIIEDVAPQAAISMDKKIFNHKSFDRLKTMFMYDKDCAYNHDLANLSPKERQEFLLRQTMLDAEQISQFLLARDGNLRPLTENGGGVTATLVDLGTDDQMWKNALFLNPKTRPSELEMGARVKMVKELMLNIRDNLAEGLITGDKNITQFAWGEVAHIRSFPTAYRLRRDAKWEKSGDRTVGRIVNDAFSLEKGFNELETKLQNLILACQAEPHKFKDAHYAPFIEAIRAWGDVVKNVHGTSGDNMLQPNVYANGHVFGKFVIGWFSKETVGRYLPPVVYQVYNYFNQATSWAHMATGSSKADMEAQEARTFINSLVDHNLIGNFLGDIMQKISYKKVLGIQIPQYQMKEIGHIGPLKIKWFATTPHNAYQLTNEVGATNAHIALDVGRDLILALAFILLVAGIKTSQEDNK